MLGSTPQPQQDSTQAAQRKLRDRLLFAMAGIAGYIDALSFVALGQVFVANITGTTVLLGLALAQGDALLTLRAFASLGGFLLGVSIAALVIWRRVNGAVWPRPVTVALSVEVVSLTLFSALGLTLGMASERSPGYILIVLAACAMGMQSVAVRTLGIADITTTYITGTWVALLEGLARYLRAEVETGEKRHAPTPAALYPQKRDALLLLVYILAAVTCGLLANANARWALIPLAPALAIVVAIAARRFGPPASEVTHEPQNQ